MKWQPGHPGFDRVAASIASRRGVSIAEARAQLAGKVIIEVIPGTVEEGNPTDTLWTESRFTTDAFRDWGLVGLERHLARDSADGRRARSDHRSPQSRIAASRERTTTGRRPASGSLHHQISRAGSTLTTRRRRTCLLGDKLSVDGGDPM